MDDRVERDLEHGWVQEHGHSVESMLSEVGAMLCQAGHQYMPVWTCEAAFWKGPVNVMTEHC